MKFILVLALSFWLCGSISAADIKLDFLGGTLNGKQLSELTVDSVTDMLGRPTRADTIDNHQTLAYLQQGLRFSCDSGTSRIKAIHLYLSQKTENWLDIGLGIESFSAFTGELPKGLNGNWKFAKFLENFKAEGAVDTSKPEKVAEGMATAEKSDALLGPSDSTRPMKEGLDFFCTGEITRPSCRVIVYYDPVTKFLNRVSVVIGQ